MPFVRQQTFRDGVIFMVPLSFAHSEMQDCNGVEAYRAWDGVVILASQGIILVMPMVRRIRVADGVVFVDEFMNCHQQGQCDDGVAAEGSLEGIDIEA